MGNNIHLSEDQIAVFAEALSSGNEASLPAEWRMHVAECKYCAHKIRMVSEIIEEGTDISGVDSAKKNFPSLP